MAKKFMYDDDSCKFFEWWQNERSDIKEAKHFLLENVIPQLEASGYVHTDLNDVDTYRHQNNLETKHHSLYVYNRGTCKCVILQAYGYLYVYAFLPVEVLYEDETHHNWNSKINDGKSEYMMTMFHIHVQDWAVIESEDKDEPLGSALDNMLDHVIGMTEHNCIKEMVWNDRCVERPNYVKVECVYKETHEHSLPHKLYGHMMFHASVLCHYFDGEEMTDKYKRHHGNDEKEVL